MKPLKDLLKHSGIYAIGQILSRIASVVLLPVYTEYLAPADYGVVGILDLTAAILSVMIGAGMASAITRYHFEDNSEQHFDRVWWTGIAYIAGVSFLLIFSMWLGRNILTEVTLGRAISEGHITLPEGSWFYSLALANCWAYCIGYVGDTYLRVRKRSGLFVLFALGRLLINVGLNVYFLVVLKWGVEGLLLGNLISTILQTTGMLMFFVWERGKPVFDMVLMKAMVRFSSPMIVTALLAMLMHEADRVIMQDTASMREVGVYSFAHKIGFAIESLCILPFASIWNVSLYEIAERDDAKKLYGDIFKYFVYGFGVLLLGGALIVHPVLPLLVNMDYLESLDQIAVVLLGFFFFGMHFMFEVPALLYKRTMLLVPAAIAGVVVNIVANYWLIPLEVNGVALGGFGAGWAGVLTYVVYGAVGLLCYRHLYPINYPWKRPLLALLGFCATYCVVRYLCFPSMGTVVQILVSILVCAAWAGLLVFEPIRLWLVARRGGHVENGSVDGEAVEAATAV
ncbi:MAG: oligosaccharide flippase family protein [Planctomycetaceae bacterium]